MLIQVNLSKNVNQIKNYQNKKMLKTVKFLKALREIDNDLNPTPFMNIFCSLH